eukprot:11614527-Alexandrium_andersonii.AAC.1
MLYAVLTGRMAAALLDALVFLRSCRSPVQKRACVRAYAVDAQGCMPHAGAASEVARRTWLFLRLHRSPVQKRARVRACVR